MYKSLMNVIMTTLLMIGFTSTYGIAQNQREHVEVALRLIGHTTLLESNDSTSLVLPIVQEENKFRINFASTFGFVPSNLIASVDSIFDIANIEDDYRLEVQDMNSKEIVYSYETKPVDNGMMPCTKRIQPKGKYSFLVSFLDDTGQPILFNSGLSAEGKNSISTKSGVWNGWSVFILLSLIFGGLTVYFWKFRGQKKTRTNRVAIGRYEFDKRNMQLIFNKESIGLTGKETDLLSLLHDSLDETVSREEILKAVWEDDGDYIGRTLDVFISKLRKKFSGDENVKIVNVRGVGYRLILNGN